MVIEIIIKIITKIVTKVTEIVTISKIRGTVFLQNLSLSTV